MSIVDALDYIGLVCRTGHCVMAQHMQPAPAESEPITLDGDDLIVRQFSQEEAA